jgi:hypothetical protein
MIYSSAVDEARKSSQNLQLINEARRKREQEDQIFDIKKKEATLSLEKARLGNVDTQANIDHQEALFKSWEKSQNAINAGKDEQIKQAEHSETMKGQQAALVASRIAQTVNPRLGASPLTNYPAQDASNDTGFSNGTKDMSDDRGFTADVSNMRPVINSRGRMSLAANKSESSQQGKIINLARQLARESAIDPKLGGRIPVTPEMIRDMMPKAKDLIMNGGQNLGDSVQNQNSDENVGKPVNNLGKIEQGKVKEGSIVKNNKTGQKLILKGGQWQPTK